MTNLTKECFEYAVCTQPFKCYWGLIQHLQFCSVKQKSKIQDSTVILEENKTYINSQSNWMQKYDTRAQQVANYYCQNFQ